MSVPVKATTIGSDPKNVPVIKDVHHDNVLESANSVREESPVKQAAADYFEDTNLGTDDLMPALNESISNDSDGLTMDFTDSKKRVESAMGMTGGTNGLSNKQKNSIGSALSSLSGTKDSKLLFGDVTKVFESGGDDLTASSLIDTINTVSGRSDVFKLLDLEAQAAFILGVSDTLIDWGIPELLDTLIDNLQDSKLKNEMLEENARRASRKGDVGQTKHFCDKMGQGRAYNIHRELITNLMKNYKIPKGNTVSKATLGGTLLSFFKWLNGNWDKDPYDESITCLEFYTFANTNAEQVLRLTDVSEYAALGPQINIELPLKTAGNLFPKMVKWGHSA